MAVNRSERVEGKKPTRLANASGAAGVRSPLSLSLSLPLSLSLSLPLSSSSISATLALPSRVFFPRRIPALLFSQFKLPNSSFKSFSFFSHGGGEREGGSERECAQPPSYFLRAYIHLTALLGAGDRQTEGGERRCLRREGGVSKEL